MVATAKIPIIDISANDVSQEEIARQLVDAAEVHGFIYIRNLGVDISASDIDGAFELVSLPKSIQRPYAHINF